MLQHLICQACSSQAFLLRHILRLRALKGRSGSIDMGKRPSAGGKTKKSAKAEPEEKVEVEDDQWLWSKIHDCIRLIRDAGHWPEAGSDPLPAEGLLPLGPDWTGADVRVDQECLGLKLSGFRSPDLAAAYLKGSTREGVECSVT